MPVIPNFTLNLNIQLVVEYLLLPPVYFSENRQIVYFGILKKYKSRQFENFSSEHIKIDHKVPFMSNLGIRAPLTISGDAG